MRELLGSVLRGFRSLSQRFFWFAGLLFLHLTESLGDLLLLLLQGLLEAGGLVQLFQCLTQLLLGLLDSLSSLGQCFAIVGLLPQLFGQFTDLLVDDRQVKGVTLANGESITSDHVVLAVGQRRVALASDVDGLEGLLLGR